MTSPDREDAAVRLAAVRLQVETRLAALALENGPFTGPLLTPREVDLGAVDLWLHHWAGILLGVTLAQNAVNPGRAAAAACPIPDAYALFDAQLPEFWGTSENPATAGWPVTCSFSQLIPGTGAA